MLIFIFSAISQFFQSSAQKCGNFASILFSWSPKETLLLCLKYFRDTGQWYLGSAAIHALVLIILGLISMTMPSIVENTNNVAPAFNSVQTDNSPTPEITKFEVGETPIDPSELNAETLKQFEAKPIGSQTAIKYDDSPIFEEAGGGLNTKTDDPQLGGLGGAFSVKNLPGPAGKGGVGSGVGSSDKPGVGGAGEGFGSRGQGHRDALLGAFGGTKASERAVGAALNWIARHQTSSGKWSLDFRSQCKNGACSGAGSIRSDEAATALALLPFLAAGQTHKSKGPYKETISKGITWLVKQQNAEGCLYGNSEQPMYAQGICTLAVCEAYGMTRDEHIGAAARKAVAFIERAQHQASGGWRYYPGDPGDTSVSGWQVMALKSGQLAGLPVNSLVFDNSQKWFRSVAVGEHLGLFTYQPYREVTPTMTAVGMLCTQYLGIERNAPAMVEGKQYLLENLPDNRLFRNTYYWYYATLAMHNFGGPEWDAWNRKMRRLLIETQDKQGCETGSWNPLEPTVDVWGEKGGRLMTTSLNALTLEVYYRYLPIFRTDSPLPESKKKEKEKEKDNVMPE